MIRFPSYKQMDCKDCGPTCLRIISKFYGRDINQSDIRQKCFTTRDGVSLLNIGDAAEQLGFRILGTKITWDQLKEEAILPCIVHWNQNHFIVVFKIKKLHGRCYVYVSDPAMGILKYTEEQFLKSWIEIKSDNRQHNKGIALLLEPTPCFYEQQQQDKDDSKFTLKNLIKYLKPHTRSILQIFLAMILASLLSLILPFITQAVVDKGIYLGNIGLIKALFFAQLGIVIGQITNDFIRNWLMVNMTARISISLISDFLSKLMRLPISFFDTKMTGDLLQRIQDHDRIQDFLTNSLISIVMAIVLFVIYSIILGGYSTNILLIFIIGTALYITWIMVFLKWRKKLDYIRFQEASNNQNHLVQLINGMQDIKLNSCEKQKRWEWERIQSRLFKINIKSLTLSQTQQIGGAFIDQTKNIIISYIAAKSVVEGYMTLGMMTSLTYIIGQLNAPVSQLISFMRESQDANISMERLGEIHNREDEEPVGSKRIHETPQDADIAFDNVCYQYEGPNSPMVLNKVSFLIPHGKITAIVGASGSGKTTLLKMMLGFYAPINGTIKVGQYHLNRYSESLWRKQCGCVMQDGYIFSNSIAENIGLSDDKPDMKRVLQASEIANIREWIEQLPLGYNTIIGADGHGLSNGQKQRILIARAAYKNSPFLFFDEATNSLDANNEKVIMENLNQLFCNKTVVIVAHRLSTVKNADNIIVLDHGKIVEQGNHASLVAKKGYYYELVRNQLELGN